MRSTRDGPVSPFSVERAVCGDRGAGPAASGIAPSSAASAVTRRSPGGRWPSNVTFPLAVAPFEVVDHQVGDILAADADRQRGGLRVPAAAADARREHHRVAARRR